MAYFKKEPVGFYISIPNYGNLVYHLNVRNISKILKLRKKPKSYVMLYMGVDQKHIGLGKALIYSIVEELKKMWDRGMTSGKIAKALNVTKNSIIGKVHRLCLTARPSPIKKISAKSETKAAPNIKRRATVKNTKVNNDSEKTVLQEAVSDLSASLPAEETNIPLVKLDNHTCRWPLGDPRDDDFCFCGKRVKTGQTYCEEHAAVAYVRVAKKV